MSRWRRSEWNRQGMQKMEETIQRQRKVWLKMWHLGVTSAETKRGRFSEAVSCGMGRFLSFGFLVLLEWNVQDKMGRLGVTLLFVGRYVVLRVTCLPVPIGRPPPRSSPQSHETGFY